jgi:hypothetical protein
LQDSENQRFLKDLILFNDSSCFHSWISLCCSAVCSDSLYKQNFAQIPLLLDLEAISTRIQALWWLQDFTAIAISTAA